MASPIPSKKGTGQFVRMGQTAGPYAADPAIQAKGQAADRPRDLKP